MESSADVLALLIASIGTDADTQALLQRYRDAQMREAYRARRR